MDARVVLRDGRDRSVRRRHPWVLSGSIARVEGDPAPGAVVAVADAKGALLAIGDFDPSSQIRVRLCRWGAEQGLTDEDWLGAALRRSLDLRQDHPLLGDTNAVRLVNAEGDALPGLTVDRYADHLAVKLGTPGMRRRSALIGELLRENTPAKGAWLRGALDAESERRLFGEVPQEPLRIHERGRAYQVDLHRGQKTGFYLDQRASRWSR